MPQTTARRRRQSQGALPDKTPIRNRLAALEKHYDAGDLTAVLDALSLLQVYVRGRHQLPAWLLSALRAAVTVQIRTTKLGPTANVRQRLDQRLDDFSRYMFVWRARRNGGVSLNQAYRIAKSEIAKATGINVDEQAIRQSCLRVRRNNFEIDAPVQALAMSEFLCGNMAFADAALHDRVRPRRR